MHKDYYACIFFILLVAFSLFSQCFAADEKAEPNDFTVVLLTAENVRLSNPTMFSERLVFLRSRMNEMSSYQKCHLEYLNSYELAYKGKPNGAITLLNDNVSVCEDLRVKVRMYGMLANLHVILGDFEKASQNIDVAIRNIELTQDKPTRVLGYSAASIVYDTLKQNDLSAEYANLLYQSEPTLSNLCKANYFQYLNEFNSSDGFNSEQKLNQSIKECNDSGNKLYALVIRIKNVQFLLEQKKLNPSEVDSIAAQLLSIQNEVNSTKYQSVISLYYAILADVFMSKGDFSSAVMYAQKSLDNDISQGVSDYKIIALNVLETEALNEEDYPKAYDFLNQKNIAEKQLYDEVQTKQIAFMTVKHSNLAKTYEIEQLNRQKAVLELEKQLARQEGNNQKLLILLILTVLGFLVLWMFKIKKRHDYFKGVSEIDHLTKVLTRKAFEEQMNELLEHAQQDKRPVHLAIMDLDHFKHVNDNHGHLIGDWVLKNVVYTCKELVEENMIISRLGGEEFCIAMADVDNDVMFNKLEAMRKAIATLDCTDSGAQLSVSASFGVTSSVTSGYSLPLLLTHADVALFEAKKNGRNQVVKFKVLKAK